MSDHVWVRRCIWARAAESEEARLSSALPFPDVTACGFSPTATARVSSTVSTAPIISASGRYTAQRVRIPVAGFVLLKGDARSWRNVAGYVFVRGVYVFWRPALLSR